MITFSNIQKIQKLDFQNYLQIQSHSHSSLKQTKDGLQKEFIVTDKVRVGKLVDDILTNGGKECDITNPLYPAARDIADSMTKTLGVTTLALLTFQVSYTCIMEYEGLKLYVKGRPDAELGNLAVIDFKVNNSCRTIEDCIRLIEFMGYDNQVWNYGKMGRKRNHYIFIYSTVVNKTFFLKRLVTLEDNIKAEEWWIEKILENGTL